MKLLNPKPKKRKLLMKHIQVSLPADLDKEIRDEAKRRKISVAKLVRERLNGEVLKPEPTQLEAAHKVLIAAAEDYNEAARKHYSGT